MHTPPFRHAGRDQQLQRPGVEHMGNPDRLGRRHQPGPRRVRTVSVADPQADEEYALAAGADPATRDSASFFFVFDVNTNIGCFEIDSCCTTPANHIAFVDEFTNAIVPSFTKGTICISGCFCECHGNPAVASNPNIDVLDVVYTLYVAFRGQSSIPDTSPVCPVNATDVDCNGHSDVIDVIKMIDVAFRSADPASVFCDPCP